MATKYKCISMRDNENVITYNSEGVSWSTNPKKTFLIERKGLRDVAMATKFWPK